MMPIIYHIHAFFNTKNIKDRMCHRLMRACAHTRV